MGNVWPPPLADTRDPNPNAPSSSIASKKKKRGRPGTLTDEQRAAKEQAKQEKFRKFLKDRSENPGAQRDLGD
jgi:hypothetical protein